MTDGRVAAPVGGLLIHVLGFTAHDLLIVVVCLLALIPVALIRANPDATLATTRPR